MNNAWNGFKKGKWTENIDVKNFLDLNYTPYEGDESFLKGATKKTETLWKEIMDLTKKEKENGGVLNADTKIISTIVSHNAGYINKDLEVIVGIQTDEAFKRSLQPFGGIKMAVQAAKMYGYDVDPSVVEIFTKYRKTHNDAVYDAYTNEMRLARKSHIITGLPDSYGRGRIIGDYRRVPLYGVDFLISKKEEDKSLLNGVMDENKIQERENLSEQIKALKELKLMASYYGYDISKPATNSKEAIQFLYFAYLAAIKEQNGAAMSIGRNATFFDIYIERDLKNGVITEQEAQELIDQFVIKLRIVKFLRTKEYNQLFSGDPTWVTESIGGMHSNGNTLVTKTAFRILHTLDNLGPAPEPNLTVLWSKKLPINFKRYCAKMSIKTSSIQYESDDILKGKMKDDYAIACCVSPMRVGKDMQLFGARANLAKCLLYAINGGYDEILTDELGNPLKVADGFEGIKTKDKLNFDDVMNRFKKMMEWLAKLYVNTLNTIHYMHDKYCYERLEMALHDSEVRRFFATGIAGLSCVADSLSAIKYANVYPIFNDKNIIVDYKVEGDFPQFGNNDDRVDSLAVFVVETFMNEIRKNKTYKNSIPTMSVLTITSNVVYGKHTGNTPCGRRKGEPFAPGANPMHQRDKNGALASLESVAKIPYCHAEDGISNTFSITPESLGKE